jgi:hypothetical protein
MRLFEISGPTRSTRTGNYNGLACTTIFARTDMDALDCAFALAARRGFEFIDIDSFEIPLALLERGPNSIDVPSLD